MTRGDHAVFLIGAAAAVVCSLGAGCGLFVSYEGFGPAPDAGAFGGMTVTSGSGGAGSLGGAGPGGTATTTTTSVGGCSAEDLSHMIVLLDPSAETPEGWLCESCGEFGALYGLFPVGAPTFGNSGGTDSHAHSVAVQDSGPCDLVSQSASSSGEAVAVSSHTHAGTTAETSVANHLPLHRNMKMIRPEAPVSSLPLGAVVMLASAALPAGFTSYAAQDGYYLRGGDSEALGGAGQHSHTTNGRLAQHPATDALAPTDGDNPTCPGPHDHGIDIPDVESPNVPQHAVVLLAQVENPGGAPLPQDMIALFDALPSSAWEVLSAEGGALFGDFLLAGSEPDFTPPGASSHEHAAWNGISRPHTGGSNREGGGFGAARSGHQHSVTLTYTQADHRPPYVEVIIARLVDPSCYAGR